MQPWDWAYYAEKVRQSGLHGMFSDVRYPSLAGTSVSRDFVEFPSTFEEGWASLPEVLENYAYHYKTGEPIPGERVRRAAEYGVALPAG